MILEVGVRSKSTTICVYRRLSHREDGGVLILLLAFDTGRGHRRARILGNHRPPG